MPFRYIVPLAAVFVALVVGLTGSPLPADASFHCMRVHAVVGGANGNASIQYVELRMTIAGQTSLTLGHTKLVFFDAAGSQTGTYTFMSNPPNGSVAGTSILIGTSDFALNSTVAPDYTMPINVMAPSGKVQFVGDSNCSFSGTIIDSVAYGSYTGTVDCPPLPSAPMGPAAALPVTGAQALTLNNLSSTCSNNATEYSLMTAAPRNNAGQSGSICTPGPCPTPVPTPTPSPTPVPLPTPTPAPGADTDGDGVPDASDNCPNWSNPTQALPPWTVPPGDPDCDGFPSTVKVGNRGSETYIGTLPNQACAANPTPNNEPTPDAWPMDNNDDKKAGLADVLAYIPVYLTSVPPAAARLDLNEDGKIGLADILTFISFYLTTCTP